jgi:hypothetical protein
MNQIHNGFFNWVKDIKNQLRFLISKNKKIFILYFIEIFISNDLLFLYFIM